MSWGNYTALRQAFPYFRGPTLKSSIQKHIVSVKSFESRNTDPISTNSTLEDHFNSIAPFSNHHLSFMPDVQVGPHFLTHLKLSLSIHSYSASVIIAICPEIIVPYYIPYENFSFTDFESWELRCTQSDNLLKSSTNSLKDFGIPYLCFQDFVDRTTYLEIFDLVNSYIHESSASSLLEFVYDGIPVGKLTCVDLVLATKIHDFTSPSISILDLWRSYCISCCLTSKFIRLISENFLFASSTFFGDYSPMNTVRLTLKNISNASCITINNGTDNGGNPSRVQFHSNSSVNEYTLKSAVWPFLKNRKFSSEGLEDSISDIFCKMSGQSMFSYSPPISNFANLLTNPSTELKLKSPKYLLLLPSSLDELISTNYLADTLDICLPNKSQIFKDQTDWIIRCIEFAIHNNLQIVIRMHPRMGSDHRVKVESSYYHELLNLLSSYNSQYVKIIWPEEKVSTYWLILWSSLCSISWSSVGLDAGRLGVNVIPSFNHFQSASIYPRDLYPDFTSSDQYFDYITKALTMPFVTHSDCLHYSHHFWIFDALYKTVKLNPESDHSTVDVTALLSASRTIYKRSTSSINYFEAEPNDFILQEMLSSEQISSSSFSISELLLQRLQSFVPEYLYKQLIHTVPAFINLNSLTY